MKVRTTYLDLPFFLLIPLSCFGFGFGYWISERAKYEMSTWARQIAGGVLMHQNRWKMRVSSHGFSAHRGEELVPMYLHSLWNSSLLCPKHLTWRQRITYVRRSMWLVSIMRNYEILFLVKIKRVISIFRVSASMLITCSFSWHKAVWEVYVRIPA